MKETNKIGQLKHCLFVANILGGNVHKILVIKTKNKTNFSSAACSAATLLLLCCCSAVLCCCSAAALLCAAVLLLCCCSAAAAAALLCCCVLLFIILGFENKPFHIFYFGSYYNRGNTAQIQHTFIKM